MGASHLPTPSSDSPTQQQLQNLIFGQQQSQQQGEQLQSSSQQSLYSNGMNGASAQFSGYAETEMQSSNGAFDSSYRNNSVFGSFIGGRTRQNTIQTNSSSFMSENNPGPFSPFQASAPDSFTAQNGSMPQQQMNGIRGYDFINEQASKPMSKPIFTNMDPFGANGSNGASLLQPHQVNKLLQHQSQQQQLQNLQNQSMMNGLIQAQTAHSQTPFGPHVPSNGAGLGLAGLVSVTNNQEEISTIFVVGFPDDMQEREFQNMFTFSPGFEAATLKIPNKDLTAYGSNAPPTSASINGRNGVGFGLGYPYNAANDPYNLVTMNQGGVVVDSRDGTTASWSSIDPDLQASLGMSNPNAQNGPAAPRKQIIGFAKFRSRAEALAARDLLQGRRVDIEKGAVLKAEMAKKNLHTKRGVGPLTVPMGGGGNVSTNGGMVGTNGMGGAGLPEGMSSVTSMLSPVAGPGSETLAARERELGTFGAMGLGGIRRDRDRFDLQDEDREARRRRETLGAVPSLSGLQSMSSMSMFGQRGPRERLEEDERERKRKEKDMLLAMDRSGGRMRQNTIPNLTSYDSFQPGASIRNGPLANLSMLSPTSDNSLASSNGYPFPISPQDGSCLDGWQASSSQSISGAAVGMRNKIGSLNLNGALHSLSIPSSSNGSASASTSGIPTRPPSSHGSSPSDVQLESFLAANSTIRAQFPTSKDSTTPQSQHAQGGQDAGPATSLTSHSSMSSLRSRSRPYSPSNEGVNVGGTSSAHSLASSGFLPNLDLQQQQNVQAQFHFQRLGQLETYAPSIPMSTSSSASVDSRSSSSSDEELIRSVSSPHGTVSPQLPSPNSGSGSSSGTRSINTSDHNPPINTLYVGNLPTSLAPGVSTTLLEENLRSLFSRCGGFRKLCFRQKSNGLMCFVEFEDVPYAAKAMQELSGHQVHGLVKGGIRLSYSKNQLGVRTPPNASSQQSRQNNLQSFGSSSSYSSIQEAFNSRQSVPGVLQVDTNALRNSRREHDVISPTYGFAASPPPRFFSPDGGYGYSSSQSIHSASLSRSTSQSFTSSFSPFESSTPPSSTPHLEAPDPLALKSLLSPSPSLDSQES